MALNLLECDRCGHVAGKGETLWIQPDPETGVEVEALCDQCVTEPEPWWKPVLRLMAPRIRQHGARQVVKNLFVPSSKKPPAW